MPLSLPPLTVLTVQVKLLLVPLHQLMQKVEFSQGVLLMLRDRGEPC